MQPSPGIHLKPLDLAPELPVVKGNKVLRQRHDIVCPIAEWGDRHLNYVEPVIEINAELALLDRLFQVAVRGRNHPQVHLHILGASQAPKLLSFEYTQEFRLHGQRKLTDFIEKARSAGGDFQDAALLSSRVGKGALFIAEQLAFQQGFGDCRAVHCQECMGAAPAILMNEAGQDFLSHAALALDENG